MAEAATDPGVQQAAISAAKTNPSLAVFFFSPQGLHTRAKQREEFASIAYACVPPVTPPGETKRGGNE